MDIKISEVEFIKLSQEVADLANKIWNTSQYTVDSIELIIGMRDYKDGKGFVLMTIAAIVNPVDLHHDLCVSVVGDANNALQQLINGLQAVHLAADKIEEKLGGKKITPPRIEDTQKNPLDFSGVGMPSLGGNGPNRNLN